MIPRLPLPLLPVAALLAGISIAPAQELFDPLADAREFEPGLLREWSKGSLNILETYADYKESFSQYRPKRYDSLSRSLVERERTWFFLFEGNLFSPILRNGEAFSRLKARTDKGNLEVDIQKSYGAAQAVWIDRGWEAGGYALVDWIDLRAEEEDNLWHPELFEGQGKNAMLIFPSGHTLLAAHGRWKDWTVDAGAHIRISPLTARDTAGKEIFRLRRKGDSSYTGEEKSWGLFLDVGKGGYSLNTLLSLEDRLETLGLGLPAFGLGEFSLAPFFRYQAYRSRYQAGAEARRRFFDRLDLYLEAAGDVHENSAGRMQAFHHIVLGQTLKVFGSTRENPAAYRRRGMKILLDADVSVSSDAVDQTVWGYAGAVTLQDVAGFLSWRLGMGYNDYTYLRLFPEKDAVGINLMLRLAW